MLRSLIDHEEEFRELDAAAGDGDLGITVRSAAVAILEWLPQAGTAGSASELLAGIAQVCASTSPSTFGSLVSRGLAAAAKALGDEQRDDLSSLVVALEAAIAMVQRRGQAEPGEKTFLDALIPALQAARTATSLSRGSAVDAPRSDRRHRGDGVGRAQTRARRRGWENGPEASLTPGAWS